MAGSLVVTVLALVGAVSAAAVASPVGMAAWAAVRKGAAATTRASPSVAPIVRRAAAGIVWGRVADMVVLLLGRLPAARGVVRDVRPVRCPTIRRPSVHTSSHSDHTRSFEAGR